MTNDGNRPVRNPSTPLRMGATSMEARTPERLLVMRPEVTIEGLDSVEESLLAVVVEERVNTPTSARMFFQAPDLADPGRPSLEDQIEFGRPVSITVPLTDVSARKLFRGRIYGLGLSRDSGSAPLLEATAFGALQPLAMTRRSRALHAVTVAEAMRLTASEHGLRSDVSVDGPPREAIVQANQSDLAFLQELARESGSEFWVEGEVLLARARSERSGPRLEIDFAADLLSCRFFADLTAQRERLSVRGWSVQDKVPVAATVAPADLAMEPGSGVSGPVYLERIRESSLPSGETLVGLGPESDEVAAKLSRTRAEANAWEFVALRASTRGNARLRVGTRLAIRGAGSRFEGGYRVTSARHTFDLKSGFQTEFEANRIGVGR